MSESYNACNSFALVASHIAADAIYIHAGTTYMYPLKMLCHDVSLSLDITIISILFQVFFPLPV